MFSISWGGGITILHKYSGRSIESRVGDDSPKEGMINKFAPSPFFTHPHLLTADVHRLHPRVLRTNDIYGAWNSNSVGGGRQ